MKKMILVLSVLLLGACAAQKAPPQVDDIASFLEIKSQLKILGQKNVDEDKFALDIQYTGQRAVEGLAVRAVAPEGNSLYTSNKVILPGETFAAVFDKSILSDDAFRNKRIKLIVDGGRFK